MIKRVKNWVRNGIIGLSLAGTIMGLSAISRLEESSRPSLNDKLAVLEASPKEKSEKYAVIMAQYAQTPHCNNMGFAHEVLGLKGFKPNNIFVLSSRHPYAGRSMRPCDGEASTENVKKVFEGLSKKVGTNDTLVVYTTGHGARLRDRESRKEVSALADDKEPVTSIDLEKYLGNIHPLKGVLVYDQCYSGEFAQKTGKGNYVAIATSDARKPSYGSWNHSLFAQSFFNSFMDGSGASREADSNKDGKVSIKEAYDYAHRTDTCTQRNQHTPSIASEVNPSNVFLK